MPAWFWRVISAIVLVAWVAGIPIAFGARVVYGIVWTVYGLLFLGTALAIPRTNERVGVRLLALRRVATGLLLLAVGLWRFGWDDVVIFPLAALELGLGIAFIWVSPRLPRSSAGMPSRGSAGAAAARART